MEISVNNVMNAGNTINRKQLEAYLQTVDKFNQNLGNL